MTCTATWMNFENIKLIDRRSYIICFHLYKISRIGKSVEAEFRLNSYQGLWQDGGTGA